MANIKQKILILSPLDKSKISQAKERYELGHSLKRLIEKTLQHYEIDIVYLDSISPERENIYFPKLIKKEQESEFSIEGFQSYQIFIFPLYVINNNFFFELHFIENIIFPFFTDSQKKMILLLPEKKNLFINNLINIFESQYKREIQLLSIINIIETSFGIFDSDFIKKFLDSLMSETKGFTIDLNWQKRYQRAKICKSIKFDDNVFKKTNLGMGAHSENCVFFYYRKILEFSEFIYHISSVLKYYIENIQQTDFGVEPQRISEYLKLQIEITLVDDFPRKKIQALKFLRDYLLSIESVYSKSHMLELLKSRMKISCLKIDSQTVNTKDEIEAAKKIANQIYLKLFKENKKTEVHPFILMDYDFYGRSLGIKTLEQLDFEIGKNKTALHVQKKIPVWCQIASMYPANILREMYTEFGENLKVFPGPDPINEFLPFCIELIKNLLDSLRRIHRIEILKSMLSKRDLDYIIDREKVVKELGNIDKRLIQLEFLVGEKEKELIDNMREVVSIIKFQPGLPEKGKIRIDDLKKEIEEIELASDSDIKKFYNNIVLFLERCLKISTID